MNGFIVDIEKATVDNNAFRRVAYTGQHMQVVYMTIAPGGEIGLEVHNDNDQFFRIEQGSAKVIVDGDEHEVGEDYAMVVPAGSEHNIVNTSSDVPLKLYTIYAPPHHEDGTIHQTKQEADADEEGFDGSTTE